MSDTVACCPDCGTSSLGNSGQRYWCPECGEAFDKGDADRRPPREWASREPTRGLAARLAAADPDEVSADD